VTENGRFDLRPKKIARWLGEGLKESGVDGGEVARMDAGGADGGKKIRVVGPAWDDVDVKMFRNAGAAGGA